MVNQTATYFEKMAKDFGLSIKIPRPNQITRNISSATNGFIGIAFLSTGAIFKKPSLIVLGTLGIAGAVLLFLDE